jgi:hypothetical protein
MRISISSLLLSLSALLVSATGEPKSNVLELNADNFDSLIGQGTPALVELQVPSFYLVVHGLKHSNFYQLCTLVVCFLRQFPSV